MTTYISVATGGCLTHMTVYATRTKNAFGNIYCEPSRTYEKKIALFPAVCRVRAPGLTYAQRTPYLVGDLFVLRGQRAQREKPHARNAALVVDLVLRERLGIFLRDSEDGEPVREGRAHMCGATT